MPERPVLVYDGTCGFCARCIRLAQRLPTAALVTPWQQADLLALGTTAERADHELLWVRRGGRIDGGAQAVAGLLIELRSALGAGRLRAACAAVSLAGRWPLPAHRGQPAPVARRHPLPAPLPSSRPRRRQSSRYSAMTLVASAGGIGS